MSILSAITAFGAGVFATIIGGVPSFILVGFIVLAGTITTLAGGSDIAIPILAFGTAFGPHIAFSGAVTAAAYAGRRGYLDTGTEIMASYWNVKKPDVMVVGGITGVCGYVIQYVYANVLHFNTDTVAMTCATLGIITRLVIGKSGLFGTLSEGEKRSLLTTEGYGVVNTLLLGLSVGCIVAGSGVYMLNAYPQMREILIANFPIMFFSLSALTFLLMMTIPGKYVPANHHISITCANATILSGNFMVGLITAIIAAFVHDFFVNTINSHNDTHLDPPSMTIFILTFIIYGLFR